MLAELAEIRLQPVLIYLGNSERDLIRRCELKVETNLREAVPDEEETLPLIQSRVTPVDEPWPDPRPVDSLMYGFGEQQGSVIGIGFALLCRCYAGQRPGKSRSDRVFIVSRKELPRVEAGARPAKNGRPGAGTI